MEPHSLLIIDDDRSSRNALQGIFISRGWEVAMATTQDEGLNLMSSCYTPDWIIVAWQQLSGNGTLFFRQVRSSHRQSRLGVLVDELSPTERAMLKRLRADTIVGKPFAAEMVFDRCVSYLPVVVRRTASCGQRPRAADVERKQDLGR